MNYPFEFDEALLTDKMLEKLGVSEWWGGSSECMDARLHLNGKSFDIHSIDEQDDDSFGYGDNPKYLPYHYTDGNWKTIYFLHELYEYIKSGGCVEAYNDFMERCKKCNLMPYIESYLKSKQSSDMQYCRGYDRNYSEEEKGVDIHTYDAGYKKDFV
jgi:hypothetical protein